MIYLTGDCHADFSRFNTDRFPEQKKLTRNDFVIICGDFGGVWDYYGESPKEKYWLNWLNDKSFTTLFVDGNHECFPRLNAYPKKEWHGGKVHEIRPNVLHLMRGEIFNLQGKTFFTFGGASSHDIDNGILEPDEIEKIKEYDRLWKSYRVNQRSWWKEELPSEEEMQHGLDVLKQHDNTVDYIISHCCANQIISLLFRGFYDHDILTGYFDDILASVKFTKWFFGHYHDDKMIMGKFNLLYENIIPLDEEDQGRLYEDLFKPEQQNVSIISEKSK